MIILNIVYCFPDLNQTGTTAYVAVPFSSAVYACPLSTPTIGVCTDITSSALSVPCAIALSADNSTLFIANQGSNEVVACGFQGGGSLTNCSYASTAGVTPIGLALYPSGSLVFLANTGSGTISVCGFSGTSVTGCSLATVTNPVVSFSSPQGIAFNAAGDLLYIAINPGSDVIKCNVSVSLGL